jgi:hypothetical protein
VPNSACIFKFFRARLAPDGKVGGFEGAKPSELINIFNFDDSFFKCRIWSSFTLDSKVSNREERPEVVFRQRFARPAQPIDDTDDAKHRRSEFFQLVYRLKHGTAGCQHVVDDRDAPAGCPALGVRSRVI